MQWVGGVGVIVLMLSILAHPGTGTFALYKAEAIEERIRPSVISTVRMTWWIYLILTSFGILLFFFAGMKPWEAINHAMTAIGTGGFTITDHKCARMVRGWAAYHVYEYDNRRGSRIHGRWGETNKSSNSI